MKKLATLFLFALLAASISFGITKKGTDGTIFIYNVVSTNAIAVTNDNVAIGRTTAVVKLHVGGDVSANNYYGNGSNLTGIVATDIVDTAVTNNYFFSAVSINNNVSVNQLISAGTVNASVFIGDGSNLTGLPVSGLTTTNADARYLLESNNLSDLDSASTARTNLGLGSLAVKSNINNDDWSGADLAIVNGGTESSTAAGARVNLGLEDMSLQASNNITITGGSVTGITDIAVADGGTGASAARSARTNLGLGDISLQASNNVIITGGSITGLSTLASNVILSTTVSASGTISANAFVGDGSALTGLPGGGDMSAANNLSDVADIGTSRTNLGLDDMALQASNNVTISGGSITGIADLAIADGGTATSSATGARITLGMDDMSIQASNNVNISGGAITGITDLAIADGGTGASDEATMKSNLNLETGTDLQAWDDDLDDIAALSQTSPNIMISDGTDWTVINPDTDEWRGKSGLAIDSDVQAWNTHLDDLADGELTGSKVGSGISATNITAGTLADARLETTVNVSEVATDRLTMGGNIDMGANYISGDGDSEGIFIETDGKVAIATGNATVALEVLGTVNATAFSGDGSQLTGIAAGGGGGAATTHNIAFSVNGEWAQSVTTNILENYLLTFYEWNGGAATMTSFKARVTDEDTGASEPAARLFINGSAVSTVNTAAGSWTTSTTFVSAALVDGDDIEIGTVAGGSNNDSKNLTVHIIAVED